MQYKEVISAFPENYINPINTLCGKNAELFILNQVVHIFTTRLGRIIGVVVSVLAVGPKVRGFKPTRGDGFLRAIEIRSTLFFEGEVKPSAPCRKQNSRV
jgi:hypothetical protein